MDPITTAIVAALTAGITSGITEAGKNSIVDAYNKLKTLLKNKFGDGSELIKSVESLETKPDSRNRQGMVGEEVVAAKAEQDSDLLQAAQTLLNELKTRPEGEQRIQSIVGNYNAQVQGSGSASVNVNHPKES